MKKSDVLLYKRIGLAFCIIIILITLAYNFYLNKTFVIDEGVYDIILNAQGEYNYIGKDSETRAAYFLIPLLRITNYESGLFLILLSTLVISLLLLYFSDNENYMLFFVLGLSPFFIRAFSNYSSFTIGLMFMCLFAMLIIKKRFFLSFLPYLIVVYLNFFLGMYLFLLFVFIVFKQKLKVAYILLFLIPLGVTTLNISLEPEHAILQNFFVEFGAQTGVSVVIFIMALISIYIFRKNPGLLYASIAVIPIFLLNFQAGLFLLNNVSVFLTSHLLIRLINEGWESSTLKYISLLLISCTLIFAGVSYINSSVIAKTPDLEPALSWINENSKKDSVVFSHYQYGYIIKFFARRNIVLDSDIDLIKEGHARLQDSQELFSSRNLEQTSSLLQKYNITHILITDSMKKGLVWDKEDEGLLFVINNNPSFRKVFGNDEVTIYEFIRQS